MAVQFCTSVSVKCKLPAIQSRRRREGTNHAQPTTQLCRWSESELFQPEQQVRYSSSRSRLVGRDLQWVRTHNRRGARHRQREAVPHFNDLGVPLILLKSESHKLLTNPPPPAVPLGGARSNTSFSFLSSFFSLNNSVNRAP